MFLLYPLSPYKLHGLLQGVAGVAAGVKYHGPEADNIISKSPVARGQFRPRQVIPRAKGWFGLKSLPRAQPAGVISTQINPMPEGLLVEV